MCFEFLKNSLQMLLEENIISKFLALSQLFLKILIFQLEQNLQ